MEFWHSWNNWRIRIEWLILMSVTIQRLLKARYPIQQYYLIQNIYNKTSATRNSVWGAGKSCSRTSHDTSTSTVTHRGKQTHEVRITVNVVSLCYCGCVLINGSVKLINFINMGESSKLSSWHNSCSIYTQEYDTKMLNLIQCSTHTFLQLMFEFQLFYLYSGSRKQRPEKHIRQWRLK
jgi:hypothetical protein